MYLVVAVLLFSNGVSLTNLQLWRWWLPTNMIWGWNWTGFSHKMSSRLWSCPASLRQCCLDRLDVAGTLSCTWCSQTTPLQVKPPLKFNFVVIVVLSILRYSVYVAECSWCDRRLNNEICGTITVHYQFTVSSDVTLIRQLSVSFHRIILHLNSLGLELYLKQLLFG